MHELYLLEIDNIIKRCETWIEIEQKTRKDENVSLVIPKLEIIIHDLKQLAQRMERYEK